MNKKILLGAATLMLAASTQLSAQNWSLTGNAGTSATTNFIGTTDKVAFKIRTNNAVRMTVNGSGNIGIGTISPTARLDIFGGTAASDTVQVLHVIAKKTGNYDIIAVNGESQPAVGYGIGVHGLGNYLGVYGEGNYGTWGEGQYGSVGFGLAADTLYATGEIHGAHGQIDLGHWGIGLFGYATNAAINYGVFGYSPDTSATSPDWAGYFAGDAAFTGKLYDVSDGKFKTNVNNLSNALDLISQLRPTTYNFKTAEYPTFGFSSRKQYGFIAQEVEKVFPEMVKNSYAPPIFNKKVKVSDEIAFKSVDYISMIPIVVKAVQEQQQLINQKDQQLADANSRISKLENDIAEIKSALASGKVSVITESAYLMQNTPNPANGTTTVRFYLPENSNGQLQLIDVAGKVVKSYKVAGSGISQVEINTANFAKGTYSYQLILDGKTVDTKTMVIAK